MPSNPFDPDHFPEPLKVLHVMREQRRNAIGLHGGDDVGIMHLLATDLKIPHQIDELASDGGSVIRHLKTLYELIDLFERRDLWQILEGLGPGHGDQVFTDDLAAEPDRPVGLVGGIDGRQGLFMKGRLDNVGIDQNVGVDEQRVIVHRRHTYPRAANSNPRATYRR